MSSWNPDFTVSLTWERCVVLRKRFCGKIHHTSKFFLQCQVSALNASALPVLLMRERSDLKLLWYIEVTCLYATRETNNAWHTLKQTIGKPYFICATLWHCCVVLQAFWIMATQPCLVSLHFKTHIAGSHNFVVCVVSWYTLSQSASCLDHHLLMMTSKLNDSS